MDAPAIFRVCRICLAMDQDMYHISEYGLSALYEQLTGIMNCTEDKLPQALCSKCADILSSALSLREMALKTMEILLYKFDVSKQNITLKDIQPISEQMSEMRNQVIHRPRLTKTEFIDFDTKNIRASELQTEFNSFTLTNDEMETDDGEEADTYEDEDNDKNDDDEKMFLEYVETLESDFVDEEDDIINDDNQVVKKLNEIIQNCKIKKLGDVVNTEKGKNRKNKNPNENELEGFIVTKLSYEEQIIEVEKRKESDSYKSAPYQCKSCYKGFNAKDVYENHIELHDEKRGAYECFICKRRYKKRSLLMYHLGQHRRKYECKLCPFVSKHRIPAINHKRFHEGSTYTCPHCFEEFHQLTTYKGHLRIKHVCDFVCEWCGYTYLNEYGLNVHKKSKHRKVDELELKGPHCETCDVTFFSNEAYNRHFKLSSKHTDNSELNRPRNAPANHKYLNVSKVSKDLVDKMVECEMCGLNIKGVREYINHCKSNHYGMRRSQYLSKKKMNSMCEHCGKRFSCKAVLDDHLLSHSGENNFGCDICGKTFSTKASLTVHIKIHTSSYKCPLCDKEFTLKHNRQRHINTTHKLYKDVKCDHCDKAFKSVAEKKAHTHHVHENKPWAKRNRNRTKSKK